MKKGVTQIIPNKAFDVWLQARVLEAAKWARGAPEVQVPTINKWLKVVFGSDTHFHCWRHGRQQDLEDAGHPLVSIQGWGRWATQAAMNFYRNHRNKDLTD